MDSLGDAYLFCANFVVRGGRDNNEKPVFQAGFDKFIRESLGSATLDLGWDCIQHFDDLILFLHPIAYKFSIPFLVI